MQLTMHHIRNTEGFAHPLRLALIAKLVHSETGLIGVSLLIDTSSVSLAGGSFPADRPRCVTLLVVGSLVCAAVVETAKVKTLLDLLLIA